jgi:hypothetical protein
VIGRALVRASACCAGAAVALVAVSTGIVPSPHDARPDGATGGPVATRSAQEADRVESLLRRHDCWSGAAPTGAPEPDHAVVTLPDQRPRLVAADVGFGIWLAGDPGVLHGFCP